MKPGPTDRPLLVILLSVNLALMVAIPLGVYGLWRLLDADIYRSGPGRLKPLLILLSILGEFLLFRRLRRVVAGIRAI